MPIKIIFLILSLACGIGIYIFYYLNIWNKKAKPHVLSWLTWGILIGLGFILSYSGGGGEGSWIFALESIACFSVAIYAFLKREINITKSDWIVFSAALIITIFYALTENATVSVILAAIIDFLGFIPTFRKSYLKPQSEPILSYFFGGLSFLFSFGALQTFSFVTLFYPATLVITNFMLIIFLLIRRKMLNI